MKKIPLLFVIIFSFQFSFAQEGIWTWIHGDSLPNQVGNFGIKGVSSPLNHPPALYEATDWKDHQGNLWLYGGSSTFSDSYNTLWKYSPTTNEWTWMHGSSSPNQLAIYGTQGISSPTNTPGCRAFGCLSWTDTTGNLWLFGGAQNYDMKNDLWKYDITMNEWTWVSGTSLINAPGMHGVKGIPSAMNYPGGRSESASSWTDDFNNLWMFGGSGYDDAGGYSILNDLMYYNISSNEWTWVSGSKFINGLASYGVKGISDPSNVPGASISYTKWKDLTGNFWIMGGGAFLNTVWKYTSGTNEWTWISGSTTSNDSGQYQTQCVYDINSNPAGRGENRAATTDDCGRFWLFGGFPNNNDLWIYDPVIQKWKWLRGTYPIIQPGDYGTIGIPVNTNNPPARNGALAWFSNNKIYVYGGYNSPSFFNDLWVFETDTLCVSNYCSIPAAIFHGTNELCTGACASFQNLSLAASSYQWLFPGASPDTSTTMNPTSICYNSPGSYDVTLIATNSNGSDTLQISNYITVYPPPTPQSIMQNGDTLFAIAGADFYQWYFNSNMIPGATNSFYVASASGDYNIIATDEHGCEVEAVINDVIAYAPYTVNSNQISIFPNPVTSTIDIRGLEENSKFEITIFNVFGEKVFTAVNCKLPIDNCQLSPGVYYMQIDSYKKIYRMKFIKQ